MGAKSTVRTISTTVVRAARNVPPARCVPVGPVRRLAQMGKMFVAANVSTCRPAISRVARRVLLTGWIVMETRRRTDARSTVKQTISTAVLAATFAIPRQRAKPVLMEPVYAQADKSFVVRGNQLGV